MSAILEALYSLRSGYTEPWTTPLIIMSPLISHAFAVLSRVVSREYFVFS